MTVERHPRFEHASRRLVRRGVAALVSAAPYLPPWIDDLPRHR